MGQTMASRALHLVRQTRYWPTLILRLTASIPHFFASPRSIVLRFAETTIESPTAIPSKSDFHDCAAGMGIPFSTSGVASHALLVGGAFCFRSPSPANGGGSNAVSLLSGDWFLLLCMVVSYLVC